MKEKLKAFLDKQKNKKPLALASDILFTVLLILLLIPGTRREIKTFVTKATMTQPKVNSNSDIYLNGDELSFSFLNGNGEEKKLSELGDSIIFLNFWATWCPPCRAEMPAIQNLYNEYGKKIKFVLVSNENASEINNYLNTNNYKLPIAAPISAPSGRLSSGTIPSTFIIGKEGKLLLSKKGAAKWDGENIKNLINNNLNN